jgi:hypothetical protein
MTTREPRVENDVARVDLRDTRSVELWCAALGINTALLVDAVRQVGENGERVAEYVRARKLSPLSRDRS